MISLIIVHRIYSFIIVLLLFPLFVPVWVFQKWTQNFLLPQEVMSRAHRAELLVTKTRLFFPLLFGPVSLIIITGKAASGMKDPEQIPNAWLPMTAKVFGWSQL